MLIDAKANAAAKCGISDGEPALFEASRLGHWEIVLLLIEARCIGALKKTASDVNDRMFIWELDENSADLLVKGEPWSESDDFEFLIF